MKADKSTTFTTELRLAVSEFARGAEKMRTLRERWQNGIRESYTGTTLTVNDIDAVFATLDALDAELKKNKRGASLEKLRD